MPPWIVSIQVIRIRSGYNSLFLIVSIQVIAIFKDVGVNERLYFAVFGESLLNGMLYYIMRLSINRIKEFI